jgi:hypothetical protein
VEGYAEHGPNGDDRGMARADPPSGLDAAAPSRPAARTCTSPRSGLKASSQAVGAQTLTQLADIHDVAAALRGAIGDLARAPAGT